MKSAAAQPREWLELQYFASSAHKQSREQKSFSTHSGGVEKRLASGLGEGVVKMIVGVASGSPGTRGCFTMVFPAG